MNSPALREVRPGPYGDALHRNLAPPVCACDHAGCARSDQRWHAIGRRRRIAEIAGKRRPALDLGRADQIGGLDHPGPSVLESFAFADHGTGRRSADHEGAISLANAGDIGNLLDIDDQVRLGPAGPELNQQIGPARQDLRYAGGCSQDANGLLDRRRGYIIEHEIGVSKRTDGTLVQHCLAV